MLMEDRMDEVLDFIDRLRDGPISCDASLGMEDRIRGTIQCASFATMHGSGSRECGQCAIHNLLGHPVGDSCRDRELFVVACVRSYWARALVELWPLMEETASTVIDLWEVMEVTASV
jgi:hypothetical protein